MRVQAGTLVATAILAGAGVASTVLASVALVAGCSSGAAGPTGTVTGTYVRVGGPAPAGGGTPKAPLSGTITFREQAGDASVTLTASTAGKFSGQLPAGSYVLTAKSGLIDNGNSSCAQPMTVQVQAGRTVKISVICAIP